MCGASLQSLNLTVLFSTRTVMRITFDREKHLTLKSLSEWDTACRLDARFKRA